MLPAPRTRTAGRSFTGTFQNTPVCLLLKRGTPLRRSSHGSSHAAKDKRNKGGKKQKEKKETKRIRRNWKKAGRRGKGNWKANVLWPRNLAPFSLPRFAPMVFRASSACRAVHRALILGRSQQTARLACATDQPPWSTQLSETAVILIERGSVRMMSLFLCFNSSRQVCDGGTDVSHFPLQFPNWLSTLPSLCLSNFSVFCFFFVHRQAKTRTRTRNITVAPDAFLPVR